MCSPTAPQPLRAVQGEQATAETHVALDSIPKPFDGSDTCPETVSAAVMHC